MSDPTRPHPDHSPLTADQSSAADTHSVGEPTHDPGSSTLTPPSGNRPAAPAGYELLDEIGRGGMGVVYRGRDTTLVRDVAVKLLQDRYTVTSLAARRFVDEAKITGQLQHPGIPPVHEVGELPDGRPFLGMMLIKGRTLADIIAEGRENRGSLIAAFEQVCQAVAYAHNHGVVHRDLKPANVMVGAFGEVQVMDWGLAKFRSETRADSAEATIASTFHDPRTEADEDLHTRAGSFLGTPAYMSPEQAIGAVDQVDERSDVFGLGAVLCAILTGEPPFVAATAESTRQLAAQKQVDPAFARLDGCGAEPGLVALCKRCLAGERDARPRNAGEVAAAVHAIRAEVEERARQAELETVRLEGERQKAEVQAQGERQKAEEQRKRRRVQLALAGFVVLVAVGGGIAAVQVQRQREEDRRAADEQAREKQRATRAEALVQALSTADTPGVPRIVEDLADLHDLARPMLVERLASAKPGSKEHLHVSLALLPGDPTQVESLLQLLLTATPAEIMVIRQALTTHAAEVNPRLWAVAEDPAAAMDRRLRALAALAGLDPRSERWTPLAGPLAQRLVTESPLLVGEWLKVFQPVRLQLLPPLAAIYRVPLSAGPNADLKQTLMEFQRKAVAVSWLAEYAFDQPARLADYLMDADADQFAVLWTPFIRVSDQGVPVFLAEIAKTLPAEMPSSDPQRETLAKRQANAAVSLLRLNQPAKVWPLFKHSPDPRVRSYLIHRLLPLGADPAAIVQRLDSEPDLSARRALLLALGEFDEAALPVAARTALLPKVQQMYRTEADPGLHAAAEWLLRTWQQEAWLKEVNAEWAKDGEGRDKRLAGIKELVTKDKEKTPPQWFVNTQGQTFVVIPGPVEFRMGSPVTEKDRYEYEVPHLRRIGRSFAVASKSVTVEEYRRFNPRYSFTERYAPEPDCPVVSVNWYQAAAYCNWLSEQEQIPPDQWVYEIKGATDIKLKADYLSLTGYRLPTEAEVECATRAGATTSRYYGETEELLGRYAWYTKNSTERTWPVGLKKPNDFGLFDAQGNCFTWCQEAYAGYPRAEGGEAVDDKEGELVITSTRGRVLRGGSFFDQPSVVRSSNRLTNVPTLRNGNDGFRPARTFIP